MAYNPRQHMRILLVIVAMGLLLVESGGKSKPAAATTDIVRIAVAPTSSTAKPRVDFETQVKPIFKSKCMPCHFEGGQMYDRLPFDRPETIKKLGHRLFTRIKEKDDQQLIEAFLTQ